MNEDTMLRDEMVRLCKSLFDRGLTPGSSGNVSARRSGGGYLVTPTNACLGFLDPARLSVLDEAFNHVGGDKPTKEIPLHRAFYETRGARCGAVVHLHSTHAVALSMLPGVDPDDVLPPLTPYPIMRLGRVALLPYVMPGDPAMGEAVAALGGTRKTVLLANHGPVVCDVSLAAAVSAMEELEEAAKLTLLLRQDTPSTLSAADELTLRRRFPAD
jgi:ribulose-5-phosphate 4-epimerase/fuculose-1-phosphate aldolase